MGCTCDINGTCAFCLALEDAAAGVPLPADPPAPDWQELQARAVTAYAKWEGTAADLGVSNDKDAEELIAIVRELAQAPLPAAPGRKEP